MNIKELFNKINIDPKKLILKNNKKILEIHTNEKINEENIAYIISYFRNKNINIRIENIVTDILNTQENVISTEGTTDNNISMNLSEYLVSNKESFINDINMELGGAIATSIRNSRITIEDKEVVISSNINKDITEIEKTISNIIKKKTLKNIIVKIKNNLSDIYEEEKSIAVEVTTPKKVVISNDDVIHGKEIKKQNLLKIEELDLQSKNSVLKVEVFTKEFKKGKEDKKSIITLGLYDGSDCILGKLFVNQTSKQGEKNFDISTFNKINIDGKYLIKGSYTLDTFIHENIIIINDINSLPSEIKTDDEVDKRIELHAHTTMSAQDATISTENLIKTAINYGHDAVAITDHGNLYAYPEAMKYADKIKILYGIESYVINDMENILYTASEDTSFDGEFVVFDIETTGFSYRYDEIIEIGATKIKNGIIVDTYSSLVKPKKHISQEISDLTSITNEMLENERSIEEVLPEFYEYFKDSVLVAHNADFDVPFINFNLKKLGIDYVCQYLDTILLSRLFLDNIKRFGLASMTKKLGIQLQSHHRAEDDSTATAMIFIHILEKLKQLDIKTIKEANKYRKKEELITRLKTNNVTIYPKNAKGLKKLYEIVSYSHTNQFYSVPRMFMSDIQKNREDFVVGSACSSGELQTILIETGNVKEVSRRMKYYDFIEVQPPKAYEYILDKSSGSFYEKEHIQDFISEYINIAKANNKLIVATGDVHLNNPGEVLAREVLLFSQNNFLEKNNFANLCFLTTREMKKEFSFLNDDNFVHQIVVNNPKSISDMIEVLKPIPNGTFTPKIEGSEEELRNMCYEKATSIYGEILPDIVKNRLDKELDSIIGNGYAVLYIISHKLVKDSLDNDYLVGSRGSVGSSLAATFSDITEINPLPPHYICKSCKNSEFIIDTVYKCGADLPDKKCPNCDERYNKDGFDIAFETFLGFEGDKEPDIDLNFSGEYQEFAHKYTEELLGKTHVFRAGTITTVAEKTAYGFTKKYFEKKEIEKKSIEVTRIAKKCEGARRSSGQHPGGLMVVPKEYDVYDFTPVQHPANDSSKGVLTTHFDYHALSGRLLKLDILGHDVPSIIRQLKDLSGFDPINVPLDDKDTMKIFTPGNDLNIGTYGVPEFGTNFVIQMLNDTKPSTFDELIKISGLSHGENVWINNAKDFIDKKQITLKDAICTRDDIMNYLISKGMPNKIAFTIMEAVRKGKGLTQDWENAMKEHGVPDWYIKSCKLIKYMFPKAHAAAYVLMSYRIAYFKVHYPEVFYTALFSTKANDIDIEIVVKGKEYVKSELDKLKIKEKDKTASKKDLDTISILELVYEAQNRGIIIENVDLELSDPTKFLLIQDKIIPPLVTVESLGEKAALTVVEARKQSEFLSVEDLKKRTGLNQTSIASLERLGCIKDLSEFNQLSLF